MTLRQTRHRFTRRAQPLALAIFSIAAQTRGAAPAGIVLQPLNPATVDDSSHSVNSATGTAINFVNQSEGAVDIYWIDYRGNRVLYRLRGVTSDIIGGYFGFRCAGNSPDSPHGTEAITSTRGADPPNHVYKADAEGVTHALVLFQVEPEYTEQARKAKVNGVVLVQFVIDERGKPQNIQVTQGIGMGLDQKAVQAIRKWKFKPAEKDGKPVATIAHAQVNFRLL